MSGQTSFPSAIDGDTQLFDVTDGVSTIAAANHNNMKEAIKAIETKLGIDGGNVPTALDTRLGHPTLGHDHGGATGTGKPLTTRFVLPWYYQGSVPSGPGLGPVIQFGRTQIIEAMTLKFRSVPVDTVLDVQIDGTSIFPTTTAQPTFSGDNVQFFPSLGITYPSGSELTVNVDSVSTGGGDDPGQDLSAFFVFRNR